MKLESMKNQSFPSVSYEQWNKKAEESLKGKTVDSLKRKTYEQIQLNPLYTRENVNSSNDYTQYPGLGDFRRGISPLGYLSTPWKIAQKLSTENVSDLKDKLYQALKKGQNAISFQLNEGLVTNVESFSELLKDIYTKFPFSIHAEVWQKEILSFLSKLAETNKGDKAKISGFIASDPIGLLVQKGGLVKTISETYDDWANVISSASEQFPHLKTIYVDSTVYHNGGGNAVQELAAAIATGVYHIEELLKRGLSIEKILSKIVFGFSIGANFFMETAKLRAARLIWRKVTEAYGASESLGKMVIFAETSRFTKTVYDPYVNMLRAGNEAFAAVLGGVQYLHVSSFDETFNKQTEFSERIARNTQLILKEESHLHRVVDPGGGSYYIEHLTTELATKAWEMFLEIEENEGIFAVLKSGWLQGEILSIKEQRMKDVFTRKQSIIGTNIYANLSEETPSHLGTETEEKESAYRETVEPILQERLAEPYERLRKQAEKLHPVVGLICIGELKKHKARADFMAGFFAAGGIKTDRSAGLEANSDVLSFIEETKYSHYALCGSDEQYAQYGADLVKFIKEKYPNIHIFMAGKPNNKEQANLTAAGIDEFVHVKSNCYATLSNLLKGLEAEQDAK
ncbi:methylmalonyl-CoA mutase small subunit [Bacillus aquiflavi]|uniref:methylmalonyl-CoA mutase n=1 Tax=Bacillus aquiflavi TaxID=2672567 RepID=A0A6B3VWE2_9BACI|nr:methylmalonyl-CoA mutase family protein [Bacillus aquiflavi]MBA4538221.1 methylmalonyl-CoA mutase small subunit [Bacillus aquiflavi]NEY82540.1 methylmalonyl-CoA mutase [Bacillus aquiflavi]